MASTAIIVIYERGNNFRVVDATRGGSVMIWRGIDYYAKMEIKFTTGKLNSGKYIYWNDWRTN